MSAAIIASAARRIKDVCRGRKVLSSLRPSAPREHPPPPPPRASSHEPSARSRRRERRWAGGVERLSSARQHGRDRNPEGRCVSDFLGVPGGHPFHADVATFFANGITGGTGGGLYCVESPTLRQQTAVFLLRGEHGASYVPPGCTGTFTDVPCPSAFADWVERLSAENITSGCDVGKYCPGNDNTRGQMAVFHREDIQPAVEPRASTRHRSLSPVSGEKGHHSDRIAIPCDTPLCARFSTRSSLRGEAGPLRRPRAQRHAQGPLEGRGDAGARFPRHLRDRDEPHGAEDPVRDRQPPGGLRLRARVRAVGGPRGEDARGRDPALLDRVLRAGRRLRRARLLAPGGAQLLEHPEHAGPRGPAGLAARSARDGPDRARRRALHGEPRADRGLLRRVPRRRRRGGAAGLPRRVPRRARRRGLSRRDLLVRARADRRHLRAVASTTSPTTRTGRSPRSTRERPARAGARAAHLGPGPEARVLPRQAHGPVGRDRAGPPGPRGHARLHAGLPLLPGRLLVPAGARARPGRRRRHDEEVHRRVGLERGRPALALDRRLLADRAAREVPGAAALRPARVDLAAVAARRGLLGRPRRRRLGGPQVRLHVRAGDGLGPAAPRHQQDVHQRRHDRRRPTSPSRAAGTSSRSTR